jgi:hypothetical protein
VGLSIIRLSVFRRNFWSVPSAGFFQEEFAAKIEAIIKTKEHAISSYRTDYTGRWLLIVAEGNSASTFFDPSTKNIRTVHPLIESSLSKRFGEKFGN